MAPLVTLAFRDNGTAHRVTVDRPRNLLASWERGGVEQLREPIPLVILGHMSLLPLGFRFSIGLSELSGGLWAWHLDAGRHCLYPFKTGDGTELADAFIRMLRLGLAARGETTHHESV